MKKLTLFILGGVVLICNVSAQNQQEVTLPVINQGVATDPIEWLIEHKEARPVEVTLVKKTELPIVANGKKIGSFTKPAGSSVHVEDLNKNEVKWLVNGDVFFIPIENTNLLELAKKSLEQLQTNVAHQEQPNQITDLVKEKLSQNPINSDDLLDIYAKYPKEISSVLEHQNINLIGHVNRLTLGGMEGDRVDITLSEKGGKKITVFCDLKSPYRIVEINQNPGYNNKFDVINGQLLFTSWKGEKNQYSLNTRGTRIVRTYHAGGDSKSLLVCAERSNIAPIAVRLKSSNGYNLVFEAASPLLL